MRKFWPFVVLVLVYLALRAPFLAQLPIWDGWGYYEKLIAAGSDYWANIFLWGHSSLFWGTLCLVPQKLFPENWFVLHCYLLLLDLVALFFFARTLEAAGKRPLWETALLTALFAFHPTIIATQLNFSLDEGLVVLFPIYLFCWWRRHAGACAILGCALALTKETGLFLAIVPPFADQAWASWRAKRLAFTSAWRIALIAPLSVFVLVMTARLIASGQGGGPVGWVDNPFSFSEMLGIVFSFRHWNAWMGFLKLALLFNYAWTITLAIILCFGWRIWKGRHTKGGAPALGTSFFLVLFFLTRFPTFLNARYVAALVPLSLLLLARELSLAVKRPAARALVLVLLVVCQWDGLVASRDPATCALIPRLPFGDHFLYDVPKLNPDNRATGFDESVYNLQFTHFDALINLAMEEIRPTMETIIVGEGWAVGVRTLGPLNRKTFHRRMLGKGTWWPKYLRFVDLKVAPLPDELWYLVLPMRSVEPELQWLRERFKSVQAKPIRHQGYQLDAYRFSEPRR